MNIFYVMCVLALAAGPLWAQGKKPASHEEPKKESGSGLRKAENGANEVLDDVEKGVKKAAHVVDTEGNKALQSVDDTIHGRNKKGSK